VRDFTEVASRQLSVKAIANRGSRVARYSRAGLAALLVGWTAITIAGCGGVAFVSGTLPPVQRNAFTVSGVVTNINFAVVTDRGTMVDVTPVSFEQQSGAVLTVNFCGAIGDQFFIGTFTTVDYSQATNSACADVVRVMPG
jgi:hypothetical protein